MRQRGRLRELLLAPLPENFIERPTRDDLRQLPLAERRKRKIEYAAQGGLFRTWVYVVALISVLVAFAALIAVVG